ncbi:sensor histidine kinase [Pedobacter lusitanus]|uniref:sensor histidine kinase n=2 Tax=Pedobacter lusitanus TaxID=1503925 RepID=UPI000AA71A62
MRQNFRYDTGYKTKHMIAYAEMNENFLSIIEKCNDLIFFTKKNGDFIHVTTAAEQLFGFSNDEFLQTNITDHIHPEDLSNVRERFHLLLSSPGSTVNLKLRNRTSHGEYLWIEGTATNMLDDSMQALMIRFNDITERINSENEQTLLIQEFTKRNQDLNQFVYIISHNLRTPLANLIGLINILEIDLLDDYNKGIVDLFKCSTDRLSETVFDLTHILTLKDNQGVKVTKVNVQKIFEKVCHSFNEQIKQLGVILTSNFDCNHILFNKSYLESILMNLLSNAIKYRLHSRQLEIKVSLTRDEQNTCTLTFSDNGMGIDMKSNKDKLFGLHQRFHNHITGNGVGLFITKSQITSLGGSIDVTSKVNHGTTFIITFRGEALNLLNQIRQPAQQ